MENFNLTIKKKKKNKKKIWGLKKCGPKRRRMVEKGRGIWIMRDLIGQEVEGGRRKKEESVSTVYGLLINKFLHMVY